MISAGEFRNGVTFEMDGQVFQVVEFQHVKPERGRRLSGPNTAMSRPVRLLNAPSIQARNLKEPSSTALT